MKNVNADVKLLINNIKLNINELIIFRVYNFFIFYWKLYNKENFKNN